MPSPGAEIGGRAGGGARFFAAREAPGYDLFVHPRSTPASSAKERRPGRRARWLAAAVLLLAGAIAVPVAVWAQATDAAPSPATPVASGSGAYDGVVPGTANLPPLAAVARRSTARLLTWPGFQQRPDGASRVFIQTTQAVTTETRSEQGKFTILLHATKVFLRNNRRPLETRYFDTPVTRISVEQRHKDVAVVMDLRAPVTPRVYSDTGQSGFHYVYAEFPAGNYLPPSETPAADAGTGATGPGAAPSGTPAQ